MGTQGVHLKGGPSFVGTRDICPALAALLVGPVQIISFVSPYTISLSVPIAHQAGHWGRQIKCLSLDTETEMVWNVWKGRIKPKLRLTQERTKFRDRFSLFSWLLRKVTKKI
jgi:hypothetical protein